LDRSVRSDETLRGCQQLLARLHLQSFFHSDAAVPIEAMHQQSLLRTVS